MRVLQRAGSGRSRKAEYTWAIYMPESPNTAHCSYMPRHRPIEGLAAQQLQHHPCRARQTRLPLGDAQEGETAQQQARGAKLLYKAAKRCDRSAPPPAEHSCHPRVQMPRGACNGGRQQCIARAGTAGTLPYTVLPAATTHVLLVTPSACPGMMLQTQDICRAPGQGCPRHRAPKSAHMAHPRTHSGMACSANTPARSGQSYSMQYP